MTAGEQSTNGQDTGLRASDNSSLVERIKDQQLKQEQATFMQAQFQDKCFFSLKMVMGIVAICTPPAVITICVLIIFDPHQDVIVKRVAESALFFSLIGLMGYVWRVFLNRSSVSRLQPETRAAETPPPHTRQKPDNHRAVSPNPKARRPNRTVDSQGTER